MDVNLLLHFKKNLYQSFAMEQAYFWDGFQFKKGTFHIYFTVWIWRHSVLWNPLYVWFIILTVKGIDSPGLIWIQATNIWRNYLALRVYFFSIEMEFKLVRIYNRFLKESFLATLLVSWRNDVFNWFLLCSVFFWTWLWPHPNSTPPPCKPFESNK